MSPTRLDIAKDDILSHIESLGQSVFMRSDIEEILSNGHRFWRLAQSTTVKKFIDFLKESGKLEEYRLDFPSRTEVRYIWGSATDYQVIRTLRPNSYFTHFTAMQLHGLTLQSPKTIYLNYEQPQKRSVNSELAQERIDNAFKRPCRTSKNQARLRDKRVCILNGRFTGQKGVITLHDETGADISVASPERTLIDIAVRPVYSGGVHSVLEAYGLARDRVSVNKLAATLSSLEYIYPYHQAIGFYLERAGEYTEKQISLIEQFDIKFDFYLVHQMKEKAYSKRWKLYYPKGL